MRASILSPELRLPHWIDLNILWPQHGCQRTGYASGDSVILAFSGKCHSVLGKSTKIDQDWPNIMSKNYKLKKKEKKFHQKGWKPTRWTFWEPIYKNTCSRPDYWDTALDSCIFFILCSPSAPSDHRQKILFWISATPSPGGTCYIRKCFG